MHMYSRKTAIANQFGMKYITPTRARKIAATSLTTGEAMTAARHLARSTQVDLMHYQTNVSPQHSVGAFLALNKGKCCEEEEGQVYGRGCGENRKVL